MTFLRVAPAVLGLVVCLSIPGQAQRSTNTTLVVQVEPEARLDPQQG